MAMEQNPALGFVDSIPIGFCSAPRTTGIRGVFDRLRESTREQMTEWGPWILIY